MVINMRTKIKEKQKWHRNLENEKQMDGKWQPAVMSWGSQTWGWWWRSVKRPSDFSYLKSSDFMGSPKRAGIEVARRSLRTEPWMEGPTTSVRTGTLDTGRRVIRTGDSRPLGPHLALRTRIWHRPHCQAGIMSLAGIWLAWEKLWNSQHKRLPEEMRNQSTLQW